MATLGPALFLVAVRLFIHPRIRLNHDFRQPRVLEPLIEPWNSIRPNIFPLLTDRREIALQIRARLYLCGSRRRIRAIYFGIERADIRIQLASA